jgi:molecular chaperone GrpE
MSENKGDSQTQGSNQSNGNDVSDGGTRIHVVGDSPSEVESLKAQLKQAQEQAEKNRNDFLYLRAEFENYKKHAIRERADASKYGSERIINEILGVLDNFERALSFKINADNQATYVQGVEMTATELRAVLSRNGVTEVPCEGLPFDPLVHEALTAEPSTNVPAGHVVRVFKKAYKLHDKLIRPAQVVVAQ